MLIHVQDVSVRFSQQWLLKDVNLSILSGQRICIVGRNGAGKSTLLRLLIGDLDPSAGEVRYQSQLRMSILEQSLPQNISSTIAEFVREGLAAQAERLARFQALGKEASENEIANLQAQIEAGGGWSLDTQIKQTCSMLGLQGDWNMSQLSGGWLRRAALAKALVSKPQVLLLDEPTNHLDIHTIEWLEKQILHYKGTVIFITHDRRFLEKMATEIFDIDRSRVSHFTMGYQRYLEQKAEQIAVETAHAVAFDKKVDQEQEWMRKGIKARGTRNTGRQRAFEKMKEEQAIRMKVQPSASFKIAEAGVSGRKVIEAFNLSAVFSGEVLFEGLDVRIGRGDKIGIVGNNGVGKSTLLRMLLQQLPPQKGVVKMGTNLEMGYFSQAQELPYPDKSVAYNVNDGNDYIDYGKGKTHVVGYLKKFLFSADKSLDSARLLSGGEKNRLLLARLFAHPTNVLVLDEPTNDLDMQMLEILEQQLKIWQGTLLVVSHDRQFLDAVVDKMLIFEADGNLKVHVGGYSDWEKKGHGLRVSAKEKLRAASQKNEKGATKSTNPPKKLSYKLQRLYDQLPQEIEALEYAITDISKQISEAAFHEKSYAEQQKILDMLSVQQNTLEEKEQRWLEIAEQVQD